MSKLKVYYNSACPVCNAGIGVEKRRMNACAIDAEWIDVHTETGAAAEIGVDREFVRERLHVVDEAGTMHVGAAAFQSLWSKTSGLRYLAAMMRFPPIRTLTSWFYNAFAKLLYLWNRAAGRW